MSIRCVKCGSGNIVDDYDHANRLPERKCLSCGFRLDPYYLPRAGMTTSPEKAICECERCEEEFEATVENARFCPECLKTIQVESLGISGRAGGCPRVAKPKKTNKKIPKEDIMPKLNGHDLCNRCVEKDPKTTKYAVLKGLCSTCFKEKTGMSVREAREKTKAAASPPETLPSGAPQEVTLERVPHVQPLKPLTILVDFAWHPDLYEKLCQVAFDEFREQSSQILVFVERGLKGSP